ncbi:MAG: hypothetical protein ACYC5O_14855 [Anaerolineae bacterium]
MLNLGSGWHYGVCVKNDGYATSLRLRRLYQVVPDEHAARRQMVRVIDESGEDYLYPSDYVVAVSVPHEVARTFSLAI